MRSASARASATSASASRGSSTSTSTSHGFAIATNRPAFIAASEPAGVGDDDRDDVEGWQLERERARHGGGGLRAFAVLARLARSLSLVVRSAGERLADVFRTD